MAWLVLLLTIGSLPCLRSEEARALIEQSRRVLVLYGWDTKETERARMIPADTMCAELLQTPIEWLGYECNYVDVAGAKELPSVVKGKYAAVIVDGETVVPLDRETKTARWLADVRRVQVPVLFLGGIPFASEDALRMLRDAFGLRGSLLPTPQVTNVKVTLSNEMRAEAKPVPRVQDYRDLQGPEDARVLLSLSARDADGDEVKFTPVFFASWGAVWLEPYVVLRASQDSQLFYADPWKLMTDFLAKAGPLPAPDTTTRDGVRIFFSHIDGDGFASPSDFKGHPFCSEMVRDRVLKVFPVPVTASVIEADIRAWTDGVEDEWQPKLADIARSIFALPNVQIASHSFSHPYRWHADDPNPGLYDEPNLKLKPVAKYPQIVADREIRGSINYINQELCPPGKQVQLMLWSGNCRPGEKVLAVCRELGVENLNGGDTVVSRLYPGMAGIAPRVMTWGDELQINAANQNEFMYANGWEGPFYGGFARVIDTFERTESVRRSKPVNVYYHFYSAMNMSSLRALEKIYRWCQEHTLHPVSALQFAQLTRDAHNTRIFKGGDRHWVIENEGYLRTLRLPESLGVPDIRRSRGVTGWTTFMGSVYVHTRGEKRTDLILKDRNERDDVLRLVSSTAEIRFDALDAAKTSFAVEGLAPADVEFGGLPAGQRCKLTINGSRQQLAANALGVLKLNLPATATVVLDASEGRRETAAR